MSASSRPTRIGWSVSITVHALAILLLLLYAYYWSFTIQGDVRVTYDGQSIPGPVQNFIRAEENPGPQAPGAARKLARRLSTHEGMKSIILQSQEQAGKATPEQNIAFVDSQASQINSIKPKDMEQMLSHIESAMGVAPPAPPEKGAPAPSFDIDSAYISDIYPATGPRKESGYKMEMTDKNGLTETFFLLPQEITPEQKRLEELFARGRSSPNLSRMLKTALRVANKQAAESPTTKPAGR